MKLGFYDRENIMTNATETYIRKLSRWAPLVIVALSFVIVGCYTILKHPVTAEEGPQGQYSESHPQEYYRQNCVECHADYSEYPYGYFYGDYPDYYFEYPRWGYYYAYPWWWDQHWYDPGSDEGDEDIADGAKAQRRGSLIPPYVTGSPAIITGGSHGTGGGGYVAPGTSVPGGKTNTGGSTGAGGDQNEKTRVRVSGADTTETATDKNETSTKATRRGGTKP